MLDYCHRVVLSTDVSQEWRTHASRFTRLWLSSMAAKKKLVLVSQSDAYAELYTIKWRNYAVSLLSTRMQRKKRSSPG